MENFFPEVSLDSWLADYKDANKSLLTMDSEFASWLENQYIPIAGGWQY